jgi:hypothetical protein
MRSRITRLILFVAAWPMAVSPALARAAGSLVYVKNGYVYVANADGSGARAVTPHSQWWAWPSESDNGTIAVAGGSERVNSGGTTESSGSSEIYAFDQQGRSLLSNPASTPGSYSSPGSPQYVDHFRISPDGSTVAYDVIGCCGFSGETTFLSPLRAGSNWSQFMDDFVEPQWVKGNAIATSMVHKDPVLLLTHNGPTIGSQNEYGFWDPASSTNNLGWSGDTAIPDGWAYQAVFASVGNTLALFLDDAPDVGGTAQNVRISLETVGPGPAYAETDDCTITLPAAQYAQPHNILQASPSFSADGRILAWGQADGIYEASVANPADCGAVRSSVHLVIAGGAMPSFAAAPLSPKLVVKPPTAAFSFAPGHPRARHSVSFNATASHEAGGRIVSYRWSFGDGQLKTSRSSRTSHAFKRRGRYVVTLTVVDALGRTARVKKSVTVGR